MQAKSKPPIWQWPVIIGSLVAFLGVVARTYVVYADLPNRTEKIEATLSDVKDILKAQQQMQQQDQSQKDSPWYWCDRCGKAGEWREKPPIPHVP